VTDVNDRAHAVVGDGAMGTQLQAADLTLDDFEACADTVETKYVRLQSR
jgi:methionine synthase I (cobalamin-dependent)